jgi:hypothetical protein
MDLNLGCGTVRREGMFVRDLTSEYLAINLILANKLATAHVFPLCWIHANRDPLDNIPGHASYCFLQMFLFPVVRRAGLHFRKRFSQHIARCILWS